MGDMSTAPGGGAADSPTVVVENNVAALEAALAQARADAEDRIWSDTVASCERKVAKAHDALADANASSYNARAELAAFQAAKAATTPEA